MNRIRPLAPLFVPLLLAAFSGTPLDAAAARLSAGGGGTEPAAADPAKQTVDAVRTVGVALFTWARDHGPKIEPKQDAESSVADLSIVAPIPGAELEAMLVPEYLPKLDLTDGWGHRIEVRFDPTLRTTPSMSVRSPGADGKFEGESYSVGAFEPAESTADVVWADGYFVRWPQKRK